MNRKRIILLALVTIFALMLLYAFGTVRNLDNSAFASNDKAAESNTSRKIPQLIDLGSKSCIPCKKMAPILDSLREEYKGRAEITFIDTRDNRQAAIDFKITLIPTQIFIDTLGVETFRHVGFFPADSIVAHLKPLGAKP
jgi:thioredoxin 1